MIILVCTYILSLHSCWHSSLAEALVGKYNEAESNVMELKRMRATVLHGVDAKKMKTRPYLKTRRFDRIVFNFPHAGFKAKEYKEVDMVKYVFSLAMVVCMFVFP